MSNPAPDYSVLYSKIQRDLFGGDRINQYFANSFDPSILIGQPQEASLQHTSGRNGNLSNTSVHVGA